MTPEVFNKHHEEQHARAQRLVKDLCNRIKQLEAVEFTEVSFKQHKLLKEIVEVITVQTNIASDYIEVLGNDHNWTIEKEIELQKEKLLNMKLIRDLDTARAANMMLTKLQTKLAGSKIIVKEILNIENPKP